MLSAGGRPPSGRRSRASRPPLRAQSPSRGLSGSLCARPCARRQPPPRRPRARRHCSSQQPPPVPWLSAPLLRRRRRPFMELWGARAPRWRPRSQRRRRRRWPSLPRSPVGALPRSVLALAVLARWVRPPRPIPAPARHGCWVGRHVPRPAMDVLHRPPGDTGVTRLAASFRGDGRGSEAGAGAPVRSAAGVSAAGAAALRGGLFLEMG